MLLGLIAEFMLELAAIHLHCMEKIYWTGAHDSPERYHNALKSGIALTQRAMARLPVVDNTTVPSLIGVQ